MKYILLYISVVFLIVFAAACNIINSPSSKANLPSDHNSSFGGFFHASIRRENNADACKTCHGQDLKGAVYNSNGTLVVTQSCYECHSNIWDDNGNGGKK